MMRKKWCFFSLMMVGVSMTFMGCSTTELEERCFPMMVAVGYEDGMVSYGVEFPKEEGEENNKWNLAKKTSFVEAKTTYENRLNKDADYNHLKVLVLEDDLLAKKTVYEEMLGVIAMTEEFPRNTYVCVVDDVEDFEEIRKRISQDLGTYLEEYLKKQEEKKNRLLTLGDLVDENENQAMVMYLPYLEMEENFIEWKGYVNISGKVWKESLLE